MPRRNMLNDIKITIKAGAAYTVAILMIVALLLICIKGLNQLNTNYLQYVGSIREIGELKAGLEKMDAYLYHYIAVPTARDNTLASIKQETDSIDQIIQTYKGRELAPEEKKILSDFDAAWSEMQRGYKEIIKVADGGNNDEVARLLAEGSYLIQARNNTLAAVRNLNDYSAGRKETNIKSGADRSVIVLLIIVVACIIFEIASWIYIQVAFINWLTKCVLMIQELGKGHLSFNRWHLNRRDEIGELTDAMDKFADNLQQNVIFNMQQISDGNINIEPAIIDNKDEIGPVLKKMVETIKNMVKEMNSLTQSAMDGKLDVRGNEQAFKGAYQEIVQGVNKTLDAVMGPINEASAILEKVSNKDMSIRMNGDYRGDHAKIKESLNLAVENLDKSLQQVAIGAEQVASASVQVSTGGQALSQGASEQASSLEEISSNLQEMSSMT
ncbi:MAG: MCP four helix bundle domain-containing protein, partial [Smithella sp.]